MTNREIQELDTLVEETNEEKLIFLYKRMRRAYNNAFVNLKVEVGSKDVLLKEQEKETNQLKRKLDIFDKAIWDLKNENFDLKNKIKKLERRKRWHQ